MSSPKKVVVKESMAELKRLMKSSHPMIVTRLRVLTEIKRAGAAGISKRDLAARTGVDPNSAHTWRRLYEQGGIDAVCARKMADGRPPVLDARQHQAVKEKLEDPRNGVRGYTELRYWVATDLGNDVKYNTLLKYCVRNFGSKVKVARKSHVKKDQGKVAAFKKTSVGSAGSPAGSKRGTTRK